MDLLITNFHFIRPLWLLIIIPALILIMLLMRQKNKQGQWHKVLILSSVLIAIALSGPTWQRVEQPLFKIKKAQVVIMDMSLSMYATDILPNRLTRAKFKLNDLVSRLGEGDTALIAYAGDAFVISPMTQDVANLKNLIPALSPDIMPVYGSAPAYAIEKTLELFKQANHYQGDIYLLTDGIEGSDTREITQLLQNTKFTLNIMGIGSKQGAPIKLPNGQLLKDDSGNIVIPKLQNSLLRGLSNKLGGRYSNLTNDTSDIDYLTSIPESTSLENQQEENQYGDEWHEVGPYLILLLLPFAALAFRRGVLMSVVALIVMFNPLLPSPAFAQDATSSQQALQTKQAPISNWWDDLWATKNQQALSSYKNNRFDEAATTFEDPQWRGAAQYKQGNYEQALEQFNRGNTPQDLFNQGNTLGKLGQFDDAIKRYEKLLKQAPDFPNAQENLDIVKELAKQKEKQEKQQGDNSKDSDDKKDQSEQEQQDNQESSDSDEKKDGEQQDQKNDQQSEDSESKSNESNDDNNKDDGDKKDKEQEQSGDKSDEQSDKEPQLTEEEKEQKKKELEKQQQAAKESQELFNNENLTPEQLQRLNQLVKKVPDNPALLLQQKMKYEARKRQHLRVTTKERKQW